MYFGFLFLLKWHVSILSFPQASLFKGFFLFNFLRNLGEGNPKKLRPPELHSEVHVEDNILEGNTSIN